MNYMNQMKKSLTHQTLRIVFACVLLIGGSGVLMRSHAQQRLGVANMNRAGIMSVYMNPATLALSPFRVDVLVAGVGTSFNQRFYDRGVAELISQNNNIDFQDSEKSSRQAIAQLAFWRANPIGAYATANFLIPSVQFAVKQYGFAITTQARFMLDMIDGNSIQISPTALSNLFGLQQHSNSMSTTNGKNLFFPVKEVRIGDVRASMHAFSEINVSAAAPVLQTDHHSLRVGVTLKRLSGIGYAMLRGNGVGASVGASFNEQMAANGLLDKALTAIASASSDRASAEQAVVDAVKSIVKAADAQVFLRLRGSASLSYYFPNVQSGNDRAGAGKQYGGFWGNGPSGWGTDIGLVYEYRSSAAEGSGSAHTPYTFKVSVALRDWGYVDYSFEQAENRYTRSFSYGNENEPVEARMYVKLADFLSGDIGAAVRKSLSTLTVAELQRRFGPEVFPSSSRTMQNNMSGQNLNQQQLNALDFITKTLSVNLSELIRLPDDQLRDIFDDSFQAVTSKLESREKKNRIFLPTNVVVQVDAPVWNRRVYANATLIINALSSAVLGTRLPSILSLSGRWEGKYLAASVPVTYHFLWQRLKIGMGLSVANIFFIGSDDIGFVRGNLRGANMYAGFRVPVGRK